MMSNVINCRVASKFLALFLTISFSTTLTAQDVFDDASDLGGLDGADSLEGLTGTDPAAPTEESPLEQAFNAARALQEEGKYAESIQGFKQIADQTGRAEPFLEMGRSFLKMDSDREAEEALSRAILSPNAGSIPGLLAEAHLLRGQVLLKSPNRYPDAVEDFTFAVQANPLSAEAQYFSGRAILLQVITSLGGGNDQSGQAALRGALQALTKAIELDPEYGEAYLDRGRVLLRMRRVDFAVEDQEKAVQLLGSDSKAQADLAFAYRSQATIESNRKDPDKNKIVADFKKSIASMDEYLKNYPAGQKRNPWDESEPLDIPSNSVLLARAETYLSLGDELDRDHSYYQKTIADCTTFLDFESAGNLEKAQAHYNRGLAHRMMDSLEKAIEEFGEAVRVSKQSQRPFYPEANLRRGIIYYHQGKFDLALTDFEEAKLNLSNPFQSDPRAMLWIGLTQVKQAKPHKAVQSFTRALRAYPDYNLAVINRGLTYMRIGNYDRALEDFDTAIRLDSSNTQAQAYRKSALARIAAN